jgi:hypothetical protein
VDDRASRNIAVPDYLAGSINGSRETGRSAEGAEVDRGRVTALPAVGVDSDCRIAVSDYLSRVVDGKDTVVRAAQSRYCDRSSPGQDGRTGDEGIGRGRLNRLVDVLTRDEPECGGKHARSASVRSHHFIFLGRRARFGVSSLAPVEVREM